MDNDPVLGRAVSQVLGADAVLTKPLVDQVVRLGAGSNEPVDLVGRQVLAVASMVRVRD